MSELMRLSPSIAKILLAQSPLHAWYQHRLGGAAIDDPTDAQTRGRIVDKLLFGIGPRIVKINYNDYRSKDAKEMKDECISMGWLPVIAKKLEEHEETVESWKRNMEYAGIRLTGESQKKLLWESDGVGCSGVLDHVITEYEGIIYDLKSCEDASDNAVGRLIQNYGHDIQQAAYMEAVHFNWPELAGRTRMVFIFAEINPPYAINTVELAGSYRELGMLKWQRAVRTWKQCLERDEWPSYSSIPSPIEVSQWQINQALEQGYDIEAP